MKGILIIGLIFLTLFAAGCTEPSNPTNGMTIVDTTNITPLEANLEIVSVSIVGNNMVITIRNNNNESIDDIYAGIVGIEENYEFIPHNVTQSVKKSIE